MLRPPVDSGCLARTASEIAPGIIMITKRAANPQFTKNPSPSTMATTTTTVTIIVNSARRGLVSLAQEVLAAGFAVELAAAFVAVVPSAVTVVGLAAALALEGSPEAVSGALALALGIGLQNIPEGAAVSLPLLRSGQSRGRAFLAGAASGLVEPLGGLLALAVAGWVSAALPWLMSAAAGCMVCVTAQEMIPEAVEQDEPAGVVSIVLGFALMMALDVAL